MKRIVQTQPRYWTILLTTVLCLVFSACNDSDDGNKEETGDTADTSTTDTNATDSASDVQTDTGDTDSETETDAGAPALRPVVFVHGGVGSADQFESQAQRFACNGYPADYISGYEYDSPNNMNPNEVLDKEIDAHIDAVLAHTGATQVDLLGHSLGTAHSQHYLKSSPERAAKVAHYVNIDGYPAEELPGGVPTLALWAGMSTYKTDETTGEQEKVPDEELGEIVGATNLRFSGMSHVEAATSFKTFPEMYKFFNDGKEPATTDILPETSEKITLAGRASSFAYNKTLEGYALAIYEVAGETGARLSDTPVYTADITGKGEFSFSDGVAGKYYEFYLYDSKGTNTITRHFYYEPFIRTDLMIRLKASDPTVPGSLSSKLPRSPNHCNIVISRQMEFIGDADNPAYAGEEGLANDSLTINGTEICTPELSPASNRTNGIFITDWNADGVTDLSQWIEDLSSTPFLMGADLFLQAADPSTGVIGVVVKSRDNPAKERKLNIPNWPSPTHQSTVQFCDFVQ